MKSAIKVGDLVWNSYNGTLRFGKVNNIRMANDGWAYYKVNWYDSEKYEKILEYYRTINPSGNYGLKEFRSGQIYRIEPEKLLKIIELHSEYKS